MPNSTEAVASRKERQSRRQTALSDRLPLNASASLPNKVSVKSTV